MTNQRESLGKRRVRRAGLRYVHSLEDGWIRRRCGRGFTYHSANGKRLTGPQTLKRIAKLAIPPAWEGVRICPDRSGHIQAIGRDAADRQQYIYHPDWVQLSSATKFDRLAQIGNLLPRIRRRVRRDLGKPELSREKVVAAIVRLIDKAHIRVGNLKYAADNGSHGATTLTPEHVDIEDFNISLDYPGKSGKKVELSITDALVSEVIRECAEIGGQYLFSVKDESGQFHPVGSSDVNQYLREVADEALTAKDFRTWWGSVLTLRYLRAALEQDDAIPAKKQLAEAIEKTAESLGHTKAVCQQSYIHPGLISAMESGELFKLLQKHQHVIKQPHAELTQDEVLLLAILPKLKLP